ADSDAPHSIYEIDGAREVANQCRSFSKNAGFTGMRLAYTVVPKGLRGRAADGTRMSLNTLWTRRTAMKSNGPPYIVQKAAAAVYTPEGQKQVRALIDFYMENARIIGAGLAAMGFTVYGGKNAPYIWVRTPRSVGSWDLFGQVRVTLAEEIPDRTRRRVDVQADVRPPRSVDGPVVSPAADVPRELLRLDHDDPAGPDQHVVDRAVRQPQRDLIDEPVVVRQ